MSYKPHAPRATVVGPFETYLRERVAAWPELTGERLRREIRELGLQAWSALARIGRGGRNTPVK